MPGRQRQVHNPVLTKAGFLFIRRAFENQKYLMINISLYFFKYIFEKRSLNFKN